MNSDRKAAIVLLVFSAFWAYHTHNLPEATLEGAPGPKFFPWLLVISLTFLSVLLFFKGKKKVNSSVPDESQEKNHQKEPFIKDFIVFLAILLYVILVKYLGFIIGTIIGLSIILFLNPERDWKAILLTSCLTGVGLYLIFKVLLKIPLPTGIWF